MLDEVTLYSPLPALDSAGLAAVSAMQKLLPELVALTLNAKQAHWNTTGPGFLGLHQLTDAIAADGRVWADRLAERAVALGLHVDARPVTVAAASSSFPLGRLSDVEAALELIASHRTRCHDCPPCADRGGGRRPGGTRHHRADHRRIGEVPMDADRTDKLTQPVPAASPSLTMSTRRTADIDEQFEVLARSLKVDLAMTRGWDRLQRRRRRNDVVVFGLLVLSVLLLAGGLATPRLVWWLTGAGAFIASFLVDARYRRWLERHPRESS